MGNTHSLVVMLLYALLGFFKCCANKLCSNKLRSSLFFKPNNYVLRLISSLFSMICFSKAVARYLK